MHAIETTITIGDHTEVEVIKYAFENQEEVIEFLNDYEHSVLDRMYEELNKLGDRTSAILLPHNRKALRRHVKGTSRKDGREPIEGSIEVYVHYVAA